MSDTKQMAEENLIVKMRSGSHLYGTNTKNSDEDYTGVFLPDEDYVFGFLKVDEVDLGKKDKDESGKNTKDAIDFKAYEVRKFIKLAMDNNPNILELLFVNQENLVYLNNYGEFLLNTKEIFPHKGLYNRFIGYATSQKRKLIGTETERLRLLKEVNDELHKRKII